MTEAAQFIIGSQVVCDDGVCGELRRVVIDPVGRAITHLVVEPTAKRSRKPMRHSSCRARADSSVTGRSTWRSCPTSGVRG